jgi:predicted nucleic acid-binding protein
VIVLDASALLALIKQEPGWDVVAAAAAVEDATVSSVNYSETLQKAARLGVQPEVVDSRLDAPVHHCEPVRASRRSPGGIVLPPGIESRPGRPSLLGAGSQPLEPRLHR